MEQKETVLPPKFSFIELFNARIYEKPLELKALLYVRTKMHFQRCFVARSLLDGRAGKARGCFSSNTVSKIVECLNCSFMLGMFNLLNNKLSSPIYQLEKLVCWCHIYETKTFKEEAQGKISLVLNLHLFLLFYSLKRTEPPDFTD